MFNQDYFKHVYCTVHHLWWQFNQIIKSVIKGSSEISINQRILRRKKKICIRISTKNININCFNI